MQEINPRNLRHAKLVDRYSRYLKSPILRLRFLQSAMKIEPPAGFVNWLPVVGSHDPDAIVGSIGERGLLRHAADDPSLLGAEIVDVMEPPFPAVAAGDDVRAAVELLVGDRQALLVTEHGRPVGLVTRTDLLEALAR